MMKQKGRSLGLFKGSTIAIFIVFMMCIPVSSMASFDKDIEITPLIDSEIDIFINGHINESGKLNSGIEIVDRPN